MHAKKGKKRGWNKCRSPGPLGNLPRQRRGGIALGTLAASVLSVLSVLFVLFAHCVRSCLFFVIQYKVQYVLHSVLYHVEQTASNTVGEQNRS